MSAANFGLMRAPSGAAVELAVTTSSASVALPVGVTSLRIANAGAVGAFVRFGVAGVTAATATGMYVPPNTVEAFEADRALTHIAAITASGTTTLNIVGSIGQ